MRDRGCGPTVKVWEEKRFPWEDAIQKEGHRLEIRVGGGSVARRAAAGGPRKKRCELPHEKGSLLGSKKNLMNK